jgi:hypothetical protein
MGDICEWSSIANILQDDALRNYLSRSRKIVAVITDYVMIEALKDIPLRKIGGLMRVLGEVPKQVVVLKSMRSVTQLRGRHCGMTRRMIESGRTKVFLR